MSEARQPPNTDHSYQMHLRSKPRLKLSNLLNVPGPIIVIPPRMHQKKSNFLGTDADLLSNGENLPTYPLFLAFAQVMKPPKRWFGTISRSRDQENRT